MNIRGGSRLLVGGAATTLLGVAWAAPEAGNGFLQGLPGRRLGCGRLSGSGCLRGRPGRRFTAGEAGGRNEPRSVAMAVAVAAVATVSLVTVLEVPMGTSMGSGARQRGGMGGGSSVT